MASRSILGTSRGHKNHPSRRPAALQDKAEGPHVRPRQIVRRIFACGLALERADAAGGPRRSSNRSHRARSRSLAPASRRPTCSPEDPERLQRSHHRPEVKGVLRRSGNQDCLPSSLPAWSTNRTIRPICHCCGMPAHVRQRLSPYIQLRLFGAVLRPRDHDLLMAGRRPGYLDKDDGY